jgi:hypothetical protein
VTSCVRNHVPPTPITSGLVSRGALGRKVSDEFTVPLYRVHHRDLHRGGEEIGEQARSIWRFEVVLTDKPGGTRIVWRFSPHGTSSEHAAGSALSHGGGDLPRDRDRPRLAAAPARFSIQMKTGGHRRDRRQPRLQN